MSRRDRSGVVLVFTLLAMLALELLAHGALLLAREQAAASRAGVLFLRATTGARAAVGEAAAAASASDSIGPADVLTGVGPELGGVASRWRLLRLGRESWLAEGWARVQAASWEAREARLLWRMDAGARVAAFTAAVEVGSPDGTRVDGRLLAIPPREVCPEGGATLDSLLPRGLTGLAAASEARSSRGGIGEVGWEDAVALIPSLADARGTPAPRDSAGVCLPGPWNWGDPEDPEAPCGGRRPWHSATGDVHVEGGSGQGVLMALGDVDMAGTRFDGVVLARGNVRFTGGAVVRGMVLASGSLSLDATSRVEGSACAALQAFRAAPPRLSASRFARGAGWLPVFD